MTLILSIFFFKSEIWLVGITKKKSWLLGLCSMVAVFLLITVQQEPPNYVLLEINLANSEQFKYNNQLSDSHWSRGWPQ